MNNLNLKGKINESKKILNIGCGNETYGTERIDFVKTETTTQVCDLNNKLPFKDNSFDEIYCKSVLEHIRNLKTLIKECFRVLKKGGEIWFRTDNASYIGFLFKNHQDYIKYFDYASKEDKHYFLFKEEHLRNLFSCFRELEVEFTCPSRKLFFLPMKFKCMHIEIKGEKKGLKGEQ